MNNINKLNTNNKLLIDEFETFASSGKTLKEFNINHTLYCAYQNSKKAGIELIDFGDIIWEDDVEAIVNTLKENRIKEFTISCHFCDLIDRLADFEQFGCKMNGICMIKTAHTNLDGSVQTSNAVRMEIL